jgi:hypothetical protein
MDFKVIITGPAKTDLGDIVKYIAKDNATAAAKVGGKLIEKSGDARRISVYRVEVAGCWHGRLPSFGGCALLDSIPSGSGDEDC